MDDSITPLLADVSIAQPPLKRLPGSTNQIIQEVQEVRVRHTSIWGRLAGLKDPVDGPFPAVEAACLSTFLFAGLSSCRRCQADTRSRSQRRRAGVQLAGRPLALRSIGYCSIVRDRGRKWREAMSQFQGCSLSVSAPCSRRCSRGIETGSGNGGSQQQHLEGAGEEFSLKTPQFPGDQSRFRLARPSNEAKLVILSSPASRRSFIRVFDENPIFQPFINTSEDASEQRRLYRPRRVCASAADKRTFQKPCGSWR